PSTSLRSKSQLSSPSSSSSSSSFSVSNVNPPSSTLPAELALPEPVASSAPPADKLKRYVALGRAYYTFYKTGLKNVYQNYRASLPQRRSLGLPVFPPTSPHSSPESVKISRADFQLVRRAAHDMRRMIPFTLVLIVCGEFTPLIVLALGDAITPFTCRIPRQVAKTTRQRGERKRAALADHQARTAGSVTPPGPGSEQELDLLARRFVDEAWIAAASGPEVLCAASVFGLVGSHRSSSFSPSQLFVRHRLRRYAQYLALDDRLIRQAGGVEGMTAQEVRIAVEERGGVGVAAEAEGALAEREERRWLERWLKKS
ncbi:hypothetical protein ASPZODRAFT_29571, partial [Penicilliopsis zonata CBS 506.65]